MMDGLTKEEIKVLSALTDAWNLWTDLKNRAQSDDLEFQTAIHTAQNLIALRVARRVDPDIWRIPD